MSETSFKSGFISIIGAPNVGKSTLLNQIVGEKLAIISPKPQTTRNRILGVKTTADYQIVLLDTPGIHRAKGTMNAAMVRTALATLATVDLILFVVEAGSADSNENRHVLRALQGLETRLFLVVNKIDLVGEKDLTPIIEHFQHTLRLVGASSTSALHGTGVDELLSRVVTLLPAGPPYYPEDAMTDLPKRFLCAEIVREKVMYLTSEEIPYAVAVTIGSFKKDEQRNVIQIQAEIHVERSSQKGIIIGKRGSMIREIGRQARLDMEELLGARVFLDLYVRVKKRWRKDPRALREFGYQ